MNFLSLILPVYAGDFDENFDSEYDCACDSICKGIILASVSKVLSAA